MRKHQADAQQQPAGVAAELPANDHNPQPGTALGGFSPQTCTNDRNSWKSRLTILARLQTLRALHHWRVLAGMAHQTKYGNFAFRRPAEVGRTSRTVREN